jgi:hypothetical protein
MRAWTLQRPIYILVHALAAGAFMFFLQTLALQAPTGTGLTWAVIFGLAAAMLAWHQSKR